LKRFFCLKKCLIFGAVVFRAKFLSKLFLPLFVFWAFFLVAERAAAQSGCPQFPQVSWWGNTSHQGVRNFVKKRHKGDWKPYIEKWEGQLKTMRSIHGRGKGAVIRSKGITLKGAALGAYVSKIDERIKVTRCLAREDEQEGRSIVTQQPAEEDAGKPAAAKGAAKSATESAGKAK